MPRPPGQNTLGELKAAVGNGSWLEAPDAVAPFLTDFSPACTMAQLPWCCCRGASIGRGDSAGSAIVTRRRSCPTEATPATAAVPHRDETGSQIVLSLRRLSIRVRQIDAANYSMIVKAGCTLAEAQAAARAADRLFPLSLGSEGTAQIGGNLSTNAGGTAVLRYGMMRDLTLGLEVVLADGPECYESLKSLRKDNTGYDVKSLFVVPRGTLGVITAACLKLFPQPADTATALVGIDSPAACLGSAGAPAHPRPASQVTCCQVDCRACGWN